MTPHLFVFDSNPAVIAAVAGAGVVNPADAIVVDWERSGKAVRQRHAAQLLGIDTQIAPDDPAALDALVAVSTIPVLCRIDGWTAHGPADLMRAIDAGASEVILPMIREPGEVEEALELAAGRIGVGVMVETVDAVKAAATIAMLPISRAYLGVMDLALERRTQSIFAPVFDGTLDRLVRIFEHVSFGFGGLTVPGCGSPVPTRLLAAEMVRVGTDFTFLRRSFLSDARHDLGGGLSAIRRMLSELTLRDSRAVAGDAAALAVFGSVNA